MSDFWVDGSRWVWCAVVKRIGSIATVRLYNHLTGECDGEEKTGRAKQTPYGVLVYAG